MNALLILTDIKFTFEETCVSKLVGVLLYARTKSTTPLTQHFSQIHYMVLQSLFQYISLVAAYEDFIGFFIS